MQITHPSIVIVAYNRPEALRRLLKSIASADYVGYTDISLMISIDGGGERYFDVIQIANSFLWKKGTKEIILQSKNLGLRNHILSCGDLTVKVDNLIIIEEDCFVSKNFYDYAVKSLTYYFEDTKIAGISLYGYSYFESFETCFIPLADGFDTYFMQVPSSLGQIWTKEQWAKFRAYYNTSPEIKQTDKIPEKVKKWPESSWKKIFYKYMLEKDLYFVYPQVSFSTNFGDPGTHLTEETQLYQVVLEAYECSPKFKFASFITSTNKYDTYFEILPECLINKGVDIDPDTCIDLMGSKPLSITSNKYTLSSKTCHQPIRSYDHRLLPVIQNLIFQLQGSSIHYAFSKSFGDLLPLTKLQQISQYQSIGFNTGKNKVASSKYYKLGYYLLNPQRLLSKLYRKFLK